MILVLGGTKESRKIVELLLERGQKVLVSVVSSYGRKLLADYDVEIQQGRLDVKGLCDLITGKEMEIIIDATHPFAREISENAIQACKQTKVDYIRFERPEMEVEEHELLRKVKTYQQAAEEVDHFDKVLLTTGSKNLKQFITVINNWQEKLLFRILPGWRQVKKLQELGATPAQIIGLQGPFSKEMNQIILRDYGVEALVTKASGQKGGLDTKLEAAFSLGIMVILIERPDLAYEKIVESYPQLITVINSI